MKTDSDIYRNSKEITDLQKKTGFTTNFNQICNEQIQKEQSFVCNEILTSQKFLIKLSKIIKKIFISVYIDDKIYSSSRKNLFTFFSSRETQKVFTFRNYNREIKNELSLTSYTQKINDYFEQIFIKIDQNIIVFFSDYFDQIYKIYSHPKILSSINQEIFFSNFNSIIENHYGIYKRKKRDDLNIIIKNWLEFKVKCDKYPMIPVNPRKFIEIQENIIFEDSQLLPCEKKYTVEELLSSELKPDICQSDCQCKNQDINLSNFCTPSYDDQGKVIWINTCPNKNQKIECDQNNCNSCKNQQIQTLIQYQKTNPFKKSEFQQDKIQENLRMKLTWGVDHYTRKNLILQMSLNLSQFEKEEIFQEIIQLANKINEENWNISNVLEILLLQKQDESLRLLSSIKSDEESSTLIFEKQQFQKQMNCIQLLLDLSRIKQMRKGFRIHSKGLGVLCDDFDGIKKNSLIGQYLGEVFPSWYWDLKQNILHKFINKIKEGKYPEFQKYKYDNLADFFNITVEKHILESKGREKFVLDPILYGNFTSRLSHSCNPNCWVVPVVVNGHYSVSMFATRDIQFNEELTFDYCSFTESREEMMNSHCLCGEVSCKIYYLRLIQNQQIFQKIELQKYFLDNSDNQLVHNFGLFMDSGNNNLNKSKIQYLDKYGFRSNTFKRSPKWVKLWTYYILQKIEEENWNLKQIVQENNKNIEIDILEVSDLQIQRIDCLMNTINKIESFCEFQNYEKTEHPVSFLNAKDQIRYLQQFLRQLILKKELKLNDKLYQNLKKLSTSKFQEVQPIIKTDDKDKDNILKIKYLLFQIGQSLKKSTDQNIKLISVILHLMSFTVCYIIIESIPKQNIKINIRKCDIINPKASYIHTNNNDEQKIQNLQEVIKQEEIKIDKEYFLFLFLFWNNPQIFYSDEEISNYFKGTVCYPNFSTIIKFFSQKKLQFNTQEFFNKLQTQPSKPWNIKKSQDYIEKLNNRRVYGSVQLDQFYLERNHISQVIDIYNMKKQQQKEQFIKFWNEGKNIF